MKRIDIEYSTYYNFISELSIRPSVKKRIKSALYRKDLSDTRDLCKTKEEELYDIPDIDEDIVKKIKTKLLDAGLHFGMTDEQLDDYMDAEFLNPIQETVRKARHYFWDILGWILVLALPTAGVIYFSSHTFKTWHESEKPVRMELPEVSRDRFEDMDSYSAHPPYADDGLSATDSKPKVK